MRPRRSTLAAISAALCLLAAPSLVLGHVELTDSSPAAGASLNTAPSAVSVTFDDELEPDVSHFTVVDSDGHKVGGGKVDLTVADRNVMNGSVSITDPGVYTVRYTVAGVDGHVLHGTFSFGYEAREPIPEAKGGEHGPDTALPAPRSPLPVLAGIFLLGAAGALLLRRQTRA
ncbi:MAG TPA: copper resistance CopC family protein [Candidatus Limnocylindria bacterium]